MPVKDMKEIEIGETISGLSPKQGLSPHLRGDDEEETCAAAPEIAEPIIAMSPRVSVARYKEAAQTLRACAASLDRSVIFAVIKELNRARMDMVRTRVGLQNRIDAIEWRLKKSREGTFHPLSPVMSLFPPETLAAISTAQLEAVLAPVCAQENEYERDLRRAVRTLPVLPWVKSIRGFGEINLATIVGECGDLSQYPNPAKLWKRMGLAVINGQRQRKVKGTLREVREQGYSPKRRAVMRMVSDSLVKLNGPDGPYYTYYLQEKERQREKLPDAKPYVIDKRAKRHMAKRALRDLWRAWRACEGITEEAA